MRRIANIEKSIQELKVGQAAICEAVTTKPKAWASLGAHTSMRMPTMQNSPDHGPLERQDKFRMERAKTEVKLFTRNTTDDMRKQLVNMNEGDLIKILSDVSGCEVRGVKKMANYGLKICCKTEKEAETLRSVPWQNAIEGANALFSPPPQADLRDISQTKYPNEILFESQVTVRQIREAINNLASNKAPGSDEITNRALKHILPVIEYHLQALMQASIDLGYFPKAFKETMTVMLRKPGKPDYIKAKIFRPIALENTLGKILESVMAITISYLTQAYELLPSQHFGGRPGRSAEDALMILSENVYKE